MSILLMKNGIGKSGGKLRFCLALWEFTWSFCFHLFSIVNESCWHAILDGLEMVSNNHQSLKARLKMHQTGCIGVK